MDDQRKQVPSRPSDEDVFGRRTVGGARWRNIVVGAGVLGGAVLVAVWATRGQAPVAEPMGHDHAAAAVAGNGQPVMLDDEQARRIGVTYALVERGPLRQEVRTVAQVAFDETRLRTVSLKFDGWAERLFVDFTGREVSAGEPLLSTYSPMLVNAEQELVLALQLVREVAGADAATKQGAEDLLQSARQRLLYWDVPADEVGRVERTGEVPKSLVIRAPYSGVIVEKLVLEGQRIMAGDPLYRIADLAVVWVEGEVFEQDMSLVQLGQSVEIELDARPGETLRGRIVFLQPTVGAESRTVQIRVALDNARGLLKPGMYATMRIRSGGSASVLHVPRSAVLATGRRDLVFVRRADGMLEPRDIVRGIATDDRVEVRSGLRAGETVVASATFLIDAESNLGSLLGGMAGMPGMDVTGSPRPVPATPGTEQRDTMPPMAGMKHDK